MSQRRVVSARLFHHVRHLTGAHSNKKEKEQRTLPVFTSSIRSRRERAMRNVSGITPELSPEWTPSDVMLTRSVPATMPRSDVVTHSCS